MISFRQFFTEARAEQVPWYRQKGATPRMRRPELADIKRDYAEKVDRKFIDSFHTIHWIALDRLEPALKGGRGPKGNTAAYRSKQELSAEGYLGPPYVPRWGGAGGNRDGGTVGLFLHPRWVTFAGNADIGSDAYKTHIVDPETGKEDYSDQKYPNQIKNQIHNKETFTSAPSQKTTHNEFLVDNWKIHSFVIMDPAQIPTLQQIDSSIPIIDANGKPVQATQQ